MEQSSVKARGVEHSMVACWLCGWNDELKPFMLLIGYPCNMTVLKCFRLSVMVELAV
jgi:hypothetical protein